MFVVGGTGASVAIALRHLIEMFYVFWLEYPVHLNHAFKLLEHLFGLKGADPMVESQLAIFEMIKSVAEDADGRNSPEMND